MVAPGEHCFSFFQVKMFTEGVSVLLTSTSLKIKNLQKKITKNKIRHAVLKIFEQLHKILEQLFGIFLSNFLAFSEQNLERPTHRQRKNKKKKRQQF